MMPRLVEEAGGTSLHGGCKEGWEGLISWHPRREQQSQVPLLIDIPLRETCSPSLADGEMCLGNNLLSECMQAFREQGTSLVS